MAKDNVKLSLVDCLPIMDQLTEHGPQTTTELATKFRHWSRGQVEKRLLFLEARGRVTREMRKIGTRNQARWSVK